MVFAKRLTAFDPDALAVDEQAVDFPMSEVIGTSYDHLQHAWDELEGEDGQDWRAALRIFQSVECSEPVALGEAHLLRPGQRLPDHDSDGPRAIAP